MQAVALLPRAFKRLSPEDREELTLRYTPALCSFLKEVSDKQQTLTVYYAAEKHFFISALIEVYPDKIIMDAPSSMIEPPLNPNDTLHVMGYLEQVPFYFVVPVFRQIIYERFPALQFPLPESLIRLQRRTTFRLMIPTDFGLDAHILLPGGKKVWGRVADISRGGLRITELPSEWVASLKREEVLNLSIELEGLRLLLTMSLTHNQVLRYAQGKKMGQVCLRFDDLPKQTEYRIARFLLRHERLFTRM
jgi:flagellar brake protein